MSEPASVERSRIRLKPDDVQFFNRQLASMARLNMPISKGLRILARDVEDPAFRQLVESVQMDLDEGLSLQEALAKHPETFSQLHLEVIKAGESTGNLAVILEELNAHSEAMQRIKSRIIEAVTYPAVISTVIGLFVLFFLVFVAPGFEEMLVERQVMAGTGIEEEQSRDKIVERLPPITRWLFAASTVVRQPVCLVFMAAGFVAAVVFLVRKISKMGEAYDEFMFSIPLFGTLFEQAALMKVTQTMRDLLLNGVSMVETLRLSANTVGRNRLHHKLEELRQAVEEGGSFSRNLSAGDVFPDTMVWKLQLAEEKGIIEDALAELSHEFNVGVDRQTTLITKFLSPLLLVFMGGVVFLMFLACFVPLTQIYAGG